MSTDNKVDIRIHVVSLSQSSVCDLTPNDIEKFSRQLREGTCYPPLYLMHEHEEILGKVEDMTYNPETQCVHATCVVDSPERVRALQRKEPSTNPLQ